MKKYFFSSTILFLLQLYVQGQSYVPEKQQPKMKIKPVVPVKA